MLKNQSIHNCLNVSSVGAQSTVRRLHWHGALLIIAPFLADILLAWQNFFERTLAPILAALPLSIGVIPWGVLCGTLALRAGYTPLQAQALSLLVFAGAAQLSAINIVGAGGSPFSLFSSVSVISARHLLYSAKFHVYVKDLPFYQRVAVAFLLTDEMFVISESHTAKTGQFSLRFALISGFSFYLIWNVATLCGIVIGSQWSHMDALGLDFAIAATFIAMVMPTIVSLPILLAVICSALSAWYLAAQNMQNSMIVSGLLGMVVGYGALRLQRKWTAA